MGRHSVDPEDVPAGTELFATDDAPGADEWQTPTGPSGYPAEMWQNDDMNDVASAFWNGVHDFAEDGDLSEAARDRMVRSARTLVQGLGAAVLTGAAPAAWDVLHGNPANLKGAATAFATAAVAAAVAYFHTRKAAREN